MMYRAKNVEGTRIMVGRHYPELDGVRGIAILLVLVFHSGATFVPAPRSVAENLHYLVADAGWVGVDLFFVLSGFLITGILLDTYSHPHYFRNFYMRRILRIFPLYYAVMCVSTLTVLLTHAGFTRRTALVEASYWLYLQNWLLSFGFPWQVMRAHLWSLGVEEQFYLMWPVLLLFAARRRAAGTLCVATVALAVIIRLVLVSWNPESAYFVTFSRLDPLALGAGVAVLFRHRGSLAPFRRTALILAAISGAVLATVGLWQRGFDAFNQTVLRFGLLPVAVFFSGFLVVALTSRDQGLLRRVLRSSSLRFIGAISYGLYVFHRPVIVLIAWAWPGRIHNYWINQFGFLVVVAACTIALAWVSFRFFETPIRNLRDRFSSDPARDAA